MNQPIPKTTAVSLEQGADMASDFETGPEEIVIVAKTGNFCTA
jgi:hypothetical protein